MYMGDTEYKIIHIESGSYLRFIFEIIMQTWKSFYTVDLISYETEEDVAFCEDTFNTVSTGIINVIK